ncbi:hypothetical protein [Actinomadura litoris]|uniref:Uncharacterized protein n=1 Tax=Actinomadura litoris TaxID=2678616 RepID=A0A7K1KU72_9ACTN|nr:hypothetical protein [Actinomadura litoris]MUN35729.1 hypothetical protein [Actinomadura litoris]
MAVRKSTAMITLIAAAASSAAFALPHRAAAPAAPAAAPAPEPAASVRDRYPRGLRNDAVTEPVNRPATRRPLASRTANGVKVLVDVLDRRGEAPATSDANVVVFHPLDGSDAFYGDLVDGHLEGELPAGEYAVVAYVETPEAKGRPSTAVVYRPRVAVKGTTALVLDAREARPVSVSVDRADARMLDGMIRIAQRLGGAPTVTVWGIPIENGYVTPTATEAGLHFSAQAVITRNGAESGSPYVYNVVTEEKGRVPAKPEFRVRTADMAEVAVRYGTEGRPVCVGGHAAAAWAEGGWVGFFTGAGAGPVTRTEYYTPGIDWRVDWMNTTPDCGFGFDQTELWYRTVRFAKPGPHKWNLTPAPLGPATPLVIWGSGGEPALAVFMHSTWDGRSILAPYAGATGSSVLRDAKGQVVYESDEPGTAHKWPVPPPGDYTLTVDEVRAASYSPLATRQHAEWRFSVRDGIVHLPSIQYRTPLGDDASAVAGAEQELALRVDRAPDARPTLQISYDDGRTWKPVGVRRRGGDWVATVRNPASGFVSLRASAAGADQTLVRAWAVRSRSS